MHWANHTFEYIRPVHTLVVLLDDEALDLNFLDIKSGRISRGHRFLGQETQIASTLPLMKLICEQNLSLLTLKSSEHDY